MPRVAKTIYLFTLCVALQLLTLADPRHSAFAADTDTPLPRGDRLFSIAITPSRVDNPAELFEAYEDALDLAVDTGIDVPGELDFIWSQVEKKSLGGQLSYADTGNLAVIDMLKRKKLPAIVTLSPFETLTNRFPPDLAGRPYDDPAVIDRFTRFVDWVYAQTEGLEIVAVVFGNEFDLHLAINQRNRAKKWAELEGLVVAVRRHVKSLPGWRAAPFALEATYTGLTESARDELQKLNQYADVIGVSYYPLKETSVHDPSILGADFARLFRLYPLREFYFLQYGYPSSPIIGSSLEKQRRFIEHTFSQWDRHRHKIRLITFTWLYDLQQGQLEQISSGVMGEVSPDQAFTAFILSLGLNGERVGEPKPAFRELQEQVRIRGW